MSKRSEGQSAPLAHSNVVSGEAVKRLVSEGWRSNGVIHHFGMTWQCGHRGSAIEIDHREHGCVKACSVCAERYGLT